MSEGAARPGTAAVRGSAVTGRPSRANGKRANAARAHPRRENGGCPRGAAAVLAVRAGHPDAVAGDGVRGRGSRTGGTVRSAGLRLLLGQAYACFRLPAAGLPRSVITSKDSF